MKKSFSIATLAAGLSVFAVNSLAVALETNPTDRPAIRAERPEDVRGWVVVSKSTYWPLCYEALDKLTEVRGQAAASDKMELAKSLEKCSAWLELAGSAAMVNEEARILTIAERMDDAAAALLDGEEGPTSREIEVLATMGELAMAKSHLIRATKDYFVHKTVKDSANKKTIADVVKEQEKEIKKARIERDRDQFRYDTAQAIRHMTVAQTYLREAVAQAGLDLDVDLDETIAPLVGDEKVSALSTKDMEVSDLAKKWFEAIEKQQLQLGTELKWQREIAVNPEL